ncbi:probable 2' cyclic ADP-D-ribose synthase BdTIR [Gastrolobium bilobum]|uniref:probable 2' cyclic ADP-D-ribose synthase BdTIR n=1 Tax=Gastrolobium bilobum TaxID=150636 RepID=UPI002AB26832|nr:probable 2' cyclic ADP-D-ribose synthase BdTIR [Gastrolobium bilobum]
MDKLALTKGIEVESTQKYPNPYTKQQLRAMQRFSANQCSKIANSAYDVFINYRRSDGKRTIAPLLHDYLVNLGVKPFLDTIGMKPGHGLFDHIDEAIHGCKVGVAILSPGYCDSYFCLHELALLRESKKRVVPIFYDIKPSQLLVKDSACYPHNVLRRFRLAVEETKYTVGLTFDSSNGDWSELLRKASDAVLMNLREVEDEENRIRLR